MSYLLFCNLLTGESDDGVGELLLRLTTKGENAQTVYRGALQTVLHKGAVPSRRLKHRFSG